MYKGIFFIIILLCFLVFIIGQRSEYSEVLDAEPIAFSTSSALEEKKGISDTIISQNPPMKRMDLRNLVNLQQTSQSYPKAVTDSQSETTTMMALQKEKLEIPSSIGSINEQILQRLAYTVSYNTTTKCPNWVAWVLIDDHTDGSFSRKGIPYIEDREANLPRQELRDWRIRPKKYEHGHMCPSADNKWSRKAMVESFYLTNMCPQHSDLNRDEWADLEEECRRWARRYGEVFIVCGPIYYIGKNKTIGGNKEIWVPDAFFKVVLAIKDTPKAIGFIYPNEYTVGTMDNFVHTVDEIEDIVSLDFFYRLPDDIENAIEGKADLAEW